MIRGWVQQDAPEIEIRLGWQSFRPKRAMVQGSRTPRFSRPFGSVHANQRGFCHSDRPVGHSNGSVDLRDLGANGSRSEAALTARQREGRRRWSFGDGRAWRARGA